ncbi:MAG: LacI family DNA-binding transcriptional regulator [Candidatus Omnitrophica bacterium]|nr:LacI family DNA-binding transcriptional regulator [Candidatus Omnitrophota bacterium]
MSSSKITIKDVAKRAGVSIATVSRFINKSPLKQENRAKVEKAVKDLGYQPLIYARRLAGGKLDSFGLIIPGYEGIFYSFYALEIIRQVASSLDEKAIDLHLHIYWNQDSFKTSLVDGVILADVIGNEKQVKRLVKEEIPLVIINRNLSDLDVNCVAVNNFKGAYEASEFLIQHGHKKIAHLAGDSRVQCSQERLEGFKSALSKAGISLKDDYIKATNFSRKEAREKLEELFKLKVPPTAIFCCSDEVASEVLNFAEEKRIEVPKELSVIGFDDNPHCLYGSLMLTTVRQPLREMAQQAVRILKENIKSKQPPQKIILDTELIIRDTVSFV